MQRSLSEEEAHALGSRVSPAEERGDLAAEFWTTLICRDKRTAERILREYMHNQLPAIDNALVRSRHREWRWFFLKWPDIRLYGTHGWRLESITSLRDDSTTSRILHRRPRAVNFVDERSAQTRKCGDADSSTRTSGSVKNNVVKGYLQPVEWTA
jgi:hypothetical protein